MKDDESLSDKREWMPAGAEVKAAVFFIQDVREAVKKLKDKISKLNRREDLELGYIDSIFGSKLT